MAAFLITSTVVQDITGIQLFTALFVVDFLYEYIYLYNNEFNNKTV